MIVSETGSQGWRSCSGDHALVVAARGGIQPMEIAALFEFLQGD
jgi:hypothetical protein